MEDGCSYCKAAVARFDCGGCFGVHYCGKECQIKHWGIHKPECLELRKLMFDADERDPASKPVALPCRELRVLNGPAVFAFFPNIWGRRILLLGEYHQVIERGPAEQAAGGLPVYDVHKWLYDLIDYAPECVDLMLEDFYLLPDQTYEKPNMTKPPRSEDIEPLSAASSPLNAIRTLFDMCHTNDPTEKMNCFSDMLRFHYIDTRFLGQDTVIGAHWYQRLVTETWHPDEDRFDFFYITDYWWAQRDSLDRYLYMCYAAGLSVDEESMEVYERYVTEVAFSVLERKSYPDGEPVPGIEVQTARVERILRNDEAYMTAFRSLMDKTLSKSAFSGDREKFKRALTQSCATDIAPRTISMDAYCLARMFENYDPSKMSRGPRGCQADRFRMNKNVIMYGGAAHIKNYIEFFKNYFGSDVMDDSLVVDRFETPDRFVVLPEPFDFFEGL